MLNTPHNIPNLGLISPSWTIGSIFGPIIGGALAKPATRYPGIFGTEGFFTEFPFALPNMMASALMVIGVSTGLLFLKVGMPWRERGNTL